MENALTYDREEIETFVNITMKRLYTHIPEGQMPMPDTIKKT
jgi:hypothetical protein